MKNLFQQVECKKTAPISSGWYHTDKGLLFWFTKEQGWSCRDDRISSEYPEYWYSPVSVKVELTDRQI